MHSFYIVVSSDGKYPVYFSRSSKVPVLSPRLLHKSLPTELLFPFAPHNLRWVPGGLSSCAPLLVLPRSVRTHLSFLKERRQHAMHGILCVPKADSFTLDRAGPFVWLYLSMRNPSSSSGRDVSRHPSSSLIPSPFTVLAPASREGVRDFSPEQEYL